MGRYNKGTTATTPMAEPLLITVYKLTYPGHSVIQQYYSYKFTDDIDNPVKVECCPGCGKNLKYDWRSHKCDGRNTLHPISEEYRNTQGIFRIKQTNDMKDYIKSLKHPVIISE